LGGCNGFRGEKICNSPLAVNMRQEERTMIVKEGDVLVCQCDDCDIELTVTKSCREGTCHIEGNIDLNCCDKPMIVK
jgi:hypothetical protein